MIRRSVWYSSRIDSVDATMPRATSISAISDSVATLPRIIMHSKRICGSVANFDIVDCTIDTTSSTAYCSNSCLNCVMLISTDRITLIDDTLCRKRNTCSRIGMPWLSTTYVQHSWYLHMPSTNTSTRSMTAISFVAFSSDIAMYSTSPSSIIITIASSSTLIRAISCSIRSITVADDLSIT